MMSQEILDQLKQGVIDYDEEAVIAAAHEALAQNMDPYSAVFDGLIPGMVEVGRLYEEQEYFVPEMLMCTDAMYSGLNILKPHLKKKDRNAKGVVVIGVVQGDLHDIGKNIIRMMFDASGFEVHDLGRDVPLDQFVEEQLKTGSNLVCLSAMMTTTMVGMKEIIEKIKEKNPKCKIMIGGVPITEDIASCWGADAYALNAINALKEAINMINSLKSIS